MKICVFIVCMHAHVWHGASVEVRGNFQEVCSSTMWVPGITQVRLAGKRLLSHHAGPENTYFYGSEK